MVLLHPIAVPPGLPSNEPPVSGEGNSRPGNHNPTNFIARHASHSPAAGLQIFAAGNNGVFTDSSDPSQQFFPADYGLPNQISVGATDNLDRPAPYSNYGPQTVDLFAPGSNIISLIPNNTFAYKSGTSMATPHVAGVCLLHQVCGLVLSSQDC